MNEIRGAYMLHAILILRKGENEIPTGEDFRKAGFAVSSAIRTNDPAGESGMEEAEKTMQMPVRGTEARQGRDAQFQSGR